MNSPAEPAAAAASSLPEEAVQQAEQPAEPTSMDVDLPPMEEGQPADAEAEAEAKPGPDVEVEADSQMQALASLKELCDSGLLPMNLYQENVAAIHRSSRRLQQWRERLREKSHQVLERLAAMQVWQCCPNPST